MEKSSRLIRCPVARKDDERPAFPFKKTKILHTYRNNSWAKCRQFIRLSIRTNNCNLFIYRQTDKQRKKDRFFTVSSPSFQIVSFNCSMKTVYAETRVLQMVLEPRICWEYELDFYLKSSLCQCSHRTRSGWLGLLSLSALWSHRGSGMRSHGSSALILGSTSPILSPELEQEQGIPSEFCYILGWCWGSLMISCLAVNVEGKEKTVSFQYDKYMSVTSFHI